MYSLLLVLVGVSAVGVFLGVFWKNLAVHTIFKNESFQKSSPFECGFTSKDNSRLPFSIRFFLLVILFLIFDVELSFLLQLPFQSIEGFFKNRLFYLTFCFVLLVGILEEWRRGVLNWVS